MGTTETTNKKQTAKDKLLNVALTAIRTKGYSATTVDELCHEAKVTKGSFFHYFESKEALAIEAAKHWSRITGEFFKSAPYHTHADPLNRFLAYIEFRKEILKGQTPEFTCLAGTMVQEVYHSNPNIRKACHDSIFAHAETLEADIQGAIDANLSNASFTAKSLAIHTQAVIQGAFILAKAGDSAELAAESIEHLLAYVRLLFNKGLPHGAGKLRKH